MTIHVIQLIHAKMVEIAAVESMATVAVVRMATLVKIVKLK